MLKPVASMLSVLCSLALIAGCGQPEGMPTEPSTTLAPLIVEAPTVLSTGRRYERQLFATREECDAAMQYGVNCVQFVELCANGKAFVLFTDIMNVAQYTLEEEETVRLEFVGLQEGVTADVESLTLHAGELEWSNYPSWPRWTLAMGDLHICGS